MSGGGGGDKTKVTGWEPATKAIKNDLLPDMRQYVQSYTNNPTAGIWTGSQLADERPMIGDAQDMQLQLVPALSRHMDQNTRVLEGFLGGAEGASNAARREAFQDQAWENFGGARQQLEERGTFAGQYGGPQSALAVGTAAGQSMRDINSLEAQMMENDVNRQFQAMQVAPSLFAARLFPSQVKESVGQRKQARDQLEKADRIQQYEAVRRAKLQTLMEGQQLLAPLTGTSSVTSGGGGGNWAQGALSGAAIGSTFGPYGTFIGAGLGALGSFL